MDIMVILLQMIQQTKGCHLACGGDYVVGGLAAVYMVIGMYDAVISFFAP